VILFSHPFAIIHASNVKKKLIICTHVQSDTQMLLDAQQVENSLDEDEFTLFTVAVLFNNQTQV